MGGLRSGRRRGIQQCDRLGTIGFAHDEPNGMQPLEPGHHAVGVITYQIGVDSVRIEHRLRDVRFDFIGKRPDDRCQLLQGYTCALYFGDRSSALWWHIVCPIQLFEG